MNAVLEVESLSKHYHGPGATVRALDGVSLSVAGGEFVVVQGPSGCGKTTLLLASGALLHPSGGSVRVTGEDPYALSSSQRAALRAARIGFVFQQFHLIPFLSVLDNVLAPSLALPSPSAASRARELVAALGLENRSAHVPEALSSGERQRVALARALLNRPSLLLADEPTGNLDPSNAAIVLGHLQSFAREGGAVLLVSHDPAVAQFAQRILKMREGSIRPAQTAPEQA